MEREKSSKEGTEKSGEKGGSGEMRGVLIFGGEGSSWIGGVIERVRARRKRGVGGGGGGGGGGRRGVTPAGGGAGGEGGEGGWERRGRGREGCVGGWEQRGEVEE